MGIYNSAVITNTGQALLAQSVAGNDLKFTTVKTSNYTYPSGTSLADLTTLTGIKQSKNITGATVYNSRVIKVSAMVDNAGVTAEYSINTIGVYATIGTAAEQLFAVIIAQEADKMPAFNSRPYSYIYDLNMTMQGAANITVTVNNAGFVNINDLNNALDGVNESITDLDETVNDRIDTLSSSVDTRINALNDAKADKTTVNAIDGRFITYIYNDTRSGIAMREIIRIWLAMIHNERLVDFTTKRTYPVFLELTGPSAITMVGYVGVSPTAMRFLLSAGAGSDVYHGVFTISDHQVTCLYRISSSVVS